MTKDLSASNESLDDPKTTASFSRKDIWSLIKEQNAVTLKKQPIAARDIPQESTLLFVGSKSSGKSGLVVRFLDRVEQNSTTIALEYTYNISSLTGRNGMKSHIAIKKSSSSEMSHL